MGLTVELRGTPTTKPYEVAFDGQRQVGLHEFIRLVHKKAVNTGQDIWKDLVFKLDQNCEQLINPNPTGNLRLTARPVEHPTHPFVITLIAGGIEIDLPDVETSQLFLNLISSHDELYIIEDKLRQGETITMYSPSNNQSKVAHSVAK